MGKFRLYTYMEVDACQWNGTNVEEIKQIGGLNLGPIYLQGNVLKIQSANGHRFRLNIWDYILNRGGKIYVLDQTNFEELFEPYNGG